MIRVFRLTIVLLFFTLLCGQTVFCQVQNNPLPAETTAAKPSQSSPIYADVSLGGFLVTVLSGFQAGGINADLNLGARINQHIGVGLGWSAIQQANECCSTGASGIGLQVRVTPYRKWLVRLEGGYVYKAYYGDDGPYAWEYSESDSQKYYYKFNLSYNFWKSMTWGIAYARTGVQYNRILDATGDYGDKVAFQPSAFSFNIGFAFPRVR